MPSQKKNHLTNFIYLNFVLLMTWIYYYCLPEFVFNVIWHFSCEFIIRGTVGSNLSWQPFQVLTCILSFLSLQTCLGPVCKMSKQCAATPTEPNLHKVSAVYRAKKNASHYFAISRRKISSGKVLLNCALFCIVAFKANELLSCSRICPILHCCHAIFRKLL